MPLYNNTHQLTLGNEYLKVPPFTNNYKSIYYYNIPNLELVDSPPYYNPLLYKERILYLANSEYEIIFENNHIGKNTHLFIQVSSQNSTSINDVELFFNDINNTPSLPLSNSTFNINNNHRIKKIIIKTKNTTGEINILITDKFLPASSTINYDSIP